MLLQTEEVSRRYTGVAVEFAPTARFQNGAKPPKLRVSQLWSRSQGLFAAFGQLVLFSAILQVVTLVMPFLMQTAIDTALPSSDASLLLSLALGFTGVVLIRGVSECLRGYTQASVSSAISYQIVLNLFSHLVRLPLGWSQKRHIGDVVSRFGSSDVVTTTLSTTIVGAALDGLLAILTIILMLYYSPRLSCLALGTVALLSLLQLAYFQRLRASNSNAIAAKAAEQTVLMESVRGLGSIKAFGLESVRQQIWQNKKLESVLASLRLAKTTATFGALRTVTLGLENVAFAYLAIMMAMRAELTIGMVFAFQAYKQQFIDAATRLVQSATDFRLLDVHMNRISDIALSQPEDIAAGDRTERERLRGTITLAGVSYRYGFGEADIFRNVNVTIAPGETIAVVGPSGGGKTTLLKILGGLLTPTAGEILIDGEPLDRFGRQNYRRQIGTVAQDDGLFAGTIAENIAFFDPDMCMTQVAAAARAAAIDADIQKMPMRYETLVGDMGSALSGGQRQRVLLARAVYREPAILIMDEGTAHLDIDTEARITESLRSLAVTRIIAAHRLETIAAADRALFVADGRVLELHRRVDDEGSGLNEKPAQPPSVRPDSPLFATCSRPRA